MVFIIKYITLFMLRVFCIILCLNYVSTCTYRAEESSEAVIERAKSDKKPDMRIKVSATSSMDLEIFFLESSRPKAGVSKFLLDWMKLVRMCKDAHDRMFRIMS